MKATSMPNTGLIQAWFISYLVSSLSTLCQEQVEVSKPAREKSRRDGSGSSTDKAKTGKQGKIKDDKETMSEKTKELKEGHHEDSCHGAGE